MAAPMNAVPGGIEDDLDDEDDLFLDDDYTNSKKPVWDPYTSDTTNVSNSGGFGKPSTKTNKTTIMKKDLKSKQIHKSSLGMDDFRTAAMRGNFDVIKSFVEQGFKVDTELRSGWTALMYAANMANCDILEYLLSKGASPNSHVDMYTVLMACCGSTSGFDERVEKCAALLLDKGAEINSHDRYHLSPLMYAVRENRVAVARRLIDAGANVDKQDTRGWTAMSWAVSKNHVAVVKLLLERKADPRKKHCDNTSAVDLADLLDTREILTLLGGTQPQDQSFPAGGVPPTYNPPQQQNGRVPSQGMESGDTSPELYTKYGEMELFLGGLDLSNYIQLFQNQQVDFTTFLRITDDDLIKMGINQIGVRKKILDGVFAVHKKEWENSSIPTAQAKHIGCADSVAMVANICKHIKYLSATVGFLRDQIAAQPQFLEVQDGTSPSQILSHCQDTSRNLTTLETELQQLTTQLQKIINSGHCDAPDMVRSAKKKSKLNIRRVFVIGVCVGTLGVALWKRDVIKDLCSAYIST